MVRLLSCNVVGVPGRVIYRSSPNEQLANNELLPDLEAQVIQILFERLKRLESEITELKADLVHPQSGVSLGKDQAIAQSNH